MDYRGTRVSPSHPVAKLRTVKRTIYIDSGDRDVSKYPTNGDFVVYLPRVYEKVVSIRLKGAEFPPVLGGSETVKTYSTVTSPPPTLTGNPFYFFLEAEGLNRSDETTPAADRSTSVDSVFAKIQVPNTTDRIIYSEDTGPTNINYYQPAIGRLDRLHLRTRLHNHTTNPYIFWPSAEYGLTIEVELLENSFDDFSSMETHLFERGVSGFGS
jgi:hypothetical protein